MSTEDDSMFIDRAIAIAIKSVANGQRPYGAVVVRDGTVLAEGSNRVLATRDPTAHAEIEAIRGACRANDSERLTGAVLYASCAPCRACRTVAQLVDITEIVYAGDCDSGLAVVWPDLDVRLHAHDRVNEAFRLMRSRE